MLCMIDDYTREHLALVADTSHKGTELTSRPHSSLDGLTPAARRSLVHVGSLAPDALATHQTMNYERTRLSK